MLKWDKIAVTRYGTGESTITYAAGAYRIESRKRAIPHANRSGSWMYTSYFLFRNGCEVREYRALKDAKAAAERMEAGHDD